MGSAYSTIAADAIARFQKVIFITGTDEHGEKIATAAMAQGSTPPDHCNLISQAYRTLWKDLDISYDKFIRTTDSKHQAIVKEFYSRVLANGDIYRADYEGIYCVSCEEYKALVLDGKLQSAETDEFIYHECLVHPALLHHPMPKNVFIMGGGEGSTARELLRHKTIDKVVMCDIDEEVVEFCKSYLVVNKEAFHDSRLEVVINDARAELEGKEERYAIIVGDLADPIEGGPCYKLYTKDFYELSLKPKLKKGGIFVTQAGPAGIFSHTEVFSCIYNTLRQVFKYVVPYSAHIPSYADIWGWVMVGL
ncbi:amp-CoA ligase [Lathyrus oleraceus]|uniref:Amp-CoA ligase n=2 Tax=Pisum sativum TaxID=3888 RepID=A0A9D4WN61_PEA|nr:amp-CoA ligase [Pisum sativum]